MTITHNDMRQGQEARGQWWLRAFDKTIEPAYKDYGKDPDGVILEGRGLRPYAPNGPHSRVIVAVLDLEEETLLLSILGIPQ